MLNRIYQKLVELQRLQLRKVREKEPVILSELDIKKSSYDKLINKGKEDDEEKIKQLKKRNYRFREITFQKDVYNQWRCHPGTSCRIT